MKKYVFLILVTVIMFLLLLCLIETNIFKRLKHNLFNDHKKINQTTKVVPPYNFSPLIQSLEDNKKYHVILMAGQSNMVGYGNLSDINKTQRMLPSSVKYYNFGLNESLVQKPTSFGPELSLSHKLHDNFPDKNFVLIKYAVDASSMYDWSSEYSNTNAIKTQHQYYGALYDDYINIINTIIEDKNVTIVGLLWMQGETDAYFEAASKEYLNNFSNFISKFRKDVNSLNLPIIAGLINPPYPQFLFVDIIREYQTKLSNEDKNLELVSTKNLSKIDDNIHYNSNGQLELGKIFFQSIKSHIK